MCNIDELLIEEADFDLKVEEEILPWLTESMEDGFVETSDGKKIHYNYVPNASGQELQGTVVISHGFCEFVGKYHEVMYYFAHMGYEVYIHEYRGHGFSTRDAEDLDLVYVKDFSEYVLDLESLMDKIVLPRIEDKSKLYLFAHSMGGCVGTLYLEKHPEIFAKAILSSPMMKMSTGSTPYWLVKIIFSLSKLLKWDYKYTPGKHGFDNKYVFDTSSACSEPRYAYVFKQRQQVGEYTTYGSSYAWARAGIAATKQLIKSASKVDCPVLLCQAGRDSMVLPEGHEKFIKNAKGVKLICFEESKHELFNGPAETIREYWHQIFDFLNSKE